MIEAIIICRMFDMHAEPAACLRALLKAGSNIAISSAIIPMTTSSSTKVKARRDEVGMDRDIEPSSKRGARCDCHVVALGKLYVKEIPVIEPEGRGFVTLPPGKTYQT